MVKIYIMIVLGLLFLLGAISGLYVPDIGYIFGLAIGTIYGLILAESKK